MPKVNMGSRPQGDWWCNCPARHTPQDKLPLALARASGVTVKVLKESDNSASLTAWSDPESQYSVVLEPGAQRGKLGKHVIASVLHLASKRYAASWLLKVPEIIRSLLAANEQLTKENKRLTKQVLRLEKQLERKKHG